MCAKRACTAGTFSRGAHGREMQTSGMNPSEQALLSKDQHPIGCEVRTGLLSPVKRPDAFPVSAQNQTQTMGFGKRLQMHVLNRAGVAQISVAGFHIYWTRAAQRWCSGAQSIYNISAWLKGSCYCLAFLACNLH